MARRDREVPEPEGRQPAPSLAPRAQVVSARHGSPPLVGREAELAVLDAQIAAALAGQPRLLLIGGEPGIGKTRLLDALTERARAAGFETLIGHAYPEGHSPYGPIVGAWRYLVERLPDERLRGELAEASAELTRLLPGLRERLPELAPHPSLGDPAWERQRLFQAVTSFWLGASRAFPLLLALDDLQWADVATLLLLQNIARRLGQPDLSGRLLLAGTYRDTELDRHHPLSSFLSSTYRVPSGQRLILRRLDEADTGAQLAQLVGPDAATALAPWVHQTTEGNPFFTEEVARHLRDTGQVGRGLGADGPPEWGLPEGIRAVIGERLSRLPETTQQVLTLAAVIGREFPYDLLASVADVDQETLLDSLDEALTAHILVDCERIDRPIYRFAHTLVAEVLYRALSRPRRQRWHRRVAEALVARQTANPARAAEAIAYHALRGNLPELAAAAAERAAQAALAVYAFEAAANHLRAALDALEDVPDTESHRAHLHEQLGDLAQISAVVPLSEGLRNLEAARDLFARLGDRRRVAQIHSRLGRNLIFAIIDTDAAYRHFQLALQLLAESEDERTLGMVVGGLAYWALSALQPAEGSAWGRRAILAAEATGSTPLRAQAETCLGANLAALGQVREGLALMEHAWQTALTSGHLPSLMFAGAMAADLLGDLWDGPAARAALDRLRLAQPASYEFLPREWANEAKVRLLTGDFAGTEPALERSRTPETPQVAGLGLLQARLLYRRGQIGHAADLLAETVAWAEQVGHRWQLALGLIDQGSMALERGDTAEAVARLQRALALWTQGGHRLGELKARFALTQVWAAAGELAEAGTELARAESLLVGEELRGLALARTQAHAVLAQATGDRALAARTWAEAADLARRYDLPYEQAQAWLAQAAVLSGEPAQAARAEALAIAERIGAQGLAERARVTDSPPAEPDGLDRLTAREGEVLRLLAAGLSNRDIAARLTVSERTVSTHLTHIFAKIGAENRAAAVAYALRHGLA